ncbi:expressed unknown protein [Seminavis robusta]|uniref:Uncharacterized protein n=1 Tax=Seminavis robusta TaxID=568900 RepID=A0A9N8E0B9_9STRA|nr:expressed unknown protein [Seminavis robusta]|eukprot:Sro522_g159670.1 n/a (297) ;mRNA; f:56097-56987
MSNKKASATGPGSATAERRKGQCRKRPIEATDQILGVVDETDYSGPVVNWNTLANRNWGMRSVVAQLPHHELDSLVGWATHHVTANNTKSTQVSNPLEMGDDPYPPLPSHLEYLQEMARDYVSSQLPKDKKKKKKGNDPFEQVLESLDTSAAVTMGHVLENMITANLLPLAELHVQRCRQLQQPPPQQCQEWTLPPEEAISQVRLAVKEPHHHHNSLTSTRTPSRVMFPPTNNNEQQVSMAQRASTEFCQRQQLEPKFVRQNMDLYDLFLPCPPPEQLDPTVKIHSNKKKTSNKYK